MSIESENYSKVLAPRPTVCVSTIDSDEMPNLAPFSFVTPLSFDPPLIGVSVGHGKDTLLNAKETEEFVIAPLTSKWREEGVRAEITLDRNESEFEEIGLTESPSKKIDPPSIREAPINIECKYSDDFKVGDHSLLVGKVVSISAEEEAIKNGRINLEELGSIGHVTGEEFCLSERTIEIERE